MSIISKDAPSCITCSNDDAHQISARKFVCRLLD